MFLGKLRKGKAFKKVKLVDGLLKYKKKSGVCAIRQIEAIGFKDHDSSIAGHKAQKTTIAAVSKRYHLPCMKEEIAHFVKTFVKCQLNRACYQKQTNFLQPLPIPPGPWHGISMDFITSLPELQGYNVILVMVDRFSKLVYILPTVATANALETAEHGGGITGCQE
jgi:hypothetical protein